jgi:TonB family protein
MPDAHPSTISRYRIVSRLDGWSIGDAFQAFDPLLERPVIVELFSLAGVSAEGCAEIKGVFYREMQRVGALAHSNIARLFDVGETADGLFATWEQVDGMPLDQALQPGATSDAPSALRWMKQVAGALESAHLKGILHLALSPSSVLIDRTGDAKVVGFGMSPVVDLLSRAKGYEWSRSPYEAPERQSAGSGTMRADWFSFGAIAREVARASLGEPPAAVADELERLLADDPVARTPSAFPVLQALESEMRARGLVQGGDEPGEKSGDSVTAVFNSIIEADRMPLPAPTPDVPGPAEVASVAAPARQTARPAVSQAPVRRQSRSGPWIAVLAAALVLIVAGLMFGIWVRSPMLRDLWNLTRGTDQAADAEPPVQELSSALAPVPSDPAATVPEAPPVASDATQSPVPDAGSEPTGLLRVVTQPAGAAITVDGEARGVSPVRVDGLALGRHSVSASLAGHAVIRQDVDLTREVRSRAITLTLAPVAPVAARMSVLAISSTPPGAAVTIDGRAVGTTPTRLDVTAGRHVVRLEQAGHAPVSREIDLVAGQAEALELALEPLAAPAAPAPPMAFEQVEIKPRQLDGLQNPEYPPVARLARQSGTVVLAWIVDERGGVTDIEVVQSTAKVFENAVLGWIRAIKFEPGRQGGKPVAVRMTRRFRFEFAR